MFSRNADYYSGLLDEMAHLFGDKVYIADDGSRATDPLRAKFPELARELANHINKLEALACEAKHLVHNPESHDDDCPVYKRGGDALCGCQLEELDASIRSLDSATTRDGGGQ